MLVKFGKQERPCKIIVDQETLTPTFARFIAEPFERVVGHSVGNALRRVLLSSLETPGVISLRIEGVPHEFMAVEGIVEDMTSIVLNVKGIRLRLLPLEENGISREPRIVTSSIEVSQEDLDAHGGRVDIKVGDLFRGLPFEVVNSQYHLFTVTRPMHKQIDFRVGFGRGYVPSERHVIPNKLVDEIVIDTAFSPVTLVNYWVENTRVGQDTDFDRLVIEVTTDGRLSPQEALSFAGHITMKNIEPFLELQEHELLFESGIKEGQSDNDSLLKTLGMRIEDIELSVRSTNCLKKAEIATIAELVCITEKEMLGYRNFGKKSLNEIKAKLIDMKLSLGMDLGHLGITPENVKDRIRELSEEKKLGRDKRKKVTAGREA